MNSQKLLLVEDERIHREMLAEALTASGFDVAAVASGQDALDLIGNNRFGIALIDICLPDMQGTQLQDVLLKQAPDCVILLMTGQATVQSAVEAMRRGAYDYLAKPFRIDLLLLKLERIMNLRRSDDTATVSSPGGMIGNSPAMKTLQQTLRAVAVTDSTVLIRGETGTGKELCARALHQLSQRHNKPLVSVNCAAIPDNLLESELFGYEPGAFTDARKTHRGYLEQAEGGILFLDEVGEIPLAMQTKLLRVLEERKIMRLGGEKEIPVDFRLLTATNRDLNQLRSDGEMREDFYYRINVVPVELPPLRERKGDIPLLISHFLRAASEDHGLSELRFSQNALQVLQDYSFPGNIRELENLIEMLQVLHPGGTVAVSHLPLSMALEVNHDSATHIQYFRTELKLKEASQDFETRFIQRVLEEEDGNRTRAAKRLGISRKNLWEKMTR